MYFQSEEKTKFSLNFFYIKYLQYLLTKKNLKQKWYSFEPHVIKGQIVTLFNYHFCCIHFICNKQIILKTHNKLPFDSK